MGNQIEKIGTLEIDENYEHHLRSWKFKRVAWGLMLLLLAAGLGGFLGPGPFSKTKMQNSKGMDVEYERIARYNAPTHFRITVPAGKDPVNLSVNAAFLRKIDIEHI